MLTAHSLFKRLSPILLISILGGCATSTTTLQSARTLEPREIQISAAASVPVSTRAAKETFDSVEVIAGEISEAINSDQNLSSAEARQGVEAAIAYTLFTPSVYPELLFRIGIVDRFDAGLKISYSLIKPEIKFQYLDIEDGLDASIFIGYAYHFDIGPSMASHVYDEEINLSGMIISPTLGLTARF